MSENVITWHDDEAYASKDDDVARAVRAYVGPYRILLVESVHGRVTWSAGLSPNAAWHEGEAATLEDGQRAAIGAIRTELAAIGRAVDGLDRDPCSALASTPPIDDFGDDYDIPPDINEPDEDESQLERLLILIVNSTIETIEYELAAKDRTRGVDPGEAERAAKSRVIEALERARDDAVRVVAAHYERRARNPRIPATPGGRRRLYDYVLANAHRLGGQITYIRCETGPLRDLEITSVLDDMESLDVLTDLDVDPRSFE